MARKVKNRFEESAFEFLKANVQGASVKYETEVLPYTVEATYRPDFIIEFPSGHKRYIETKGYLRPRQDIPKMVAVKRQHPDLDIRIFFQVDKKLSAKMKYSDWAAKYGFPCCFGKVPDDWLQE